jgi:hypothetical protein
MAGGDVLLPQWHFLTVTFPQLMQYHASHAMTGLKEGGTAVLAVRGSITYRMTVGLKLVEEGLILLVLRCD